VGGLGAFQGGDRGVASRGFVVRLSETRLATVQPGAPRHRSSRALAAIELARIERAYVPGPIQVLSIMRRQPALYVPPTRYKTGTSARARAGTSVHNPSCRTVQFPARTCPRVPASGRASPTRLSLVMKGPRFESGRRLRLICRDCSPDRGFSEGLRGLREVYVSEVLEKEGNFAGFFPYDSLSATSFAVVLSSRPESNFSRDLTPKQH
jgi:hypothetical protein